MKYVQQTIDKTVLLLFKSPQNYAFIESEMKKMEIENFELLSSKILEVRTHHESLSYQSLIKAFILMNFQHILGNTVVTFKSLHFP